MPILSVACFVYPACCVQLYFVFACLRVYVTVLQCFRLLSLPRPGRVPCRIHDERVSLRVYTIVYADIDYMVRASRRVLRLFMLNTSLNNHGVACPSAIVLKSVHRLTAGNYTSIWRALRCAAQDVPEYYNKHVTRGSAYSRTTSSH